MRHMSRLLASVLEAPGANYLEKPRTVSFNVAKSVTAAVRPVSEQHFEGGQVLLSGKL